MKTLSDALYAHLSQGTTSLAMLWRLTRTDGLVMGFTDLDTDITVDGVWYKAATGIAPTTISKSSDLSVDNLDVEGSLEDDRITATDIANGVYDFAQVDIVQCNWRELPTSFTPGQVMWHVSGVLGEVQTDDMRFKVEIRSLTQALTQNHGKTTAIVCQATFGDSKCQINLAPLAQTGTVARSVGDRTFVSYDLQDYAGGYFQGGKVVFTGPSAIDGFVGEVSTFNGGTIGMFLPPPNGLPDGATFTCTPGCDKSLTTCQNKWGNAINFQGFPHIPGTDAWQAGTHSDGLVNVMETMYDEGIRENGSTDTSDDKGSQSTTVSQPVATGNVYGDTGNTSQDLSDVSTATD